MKTSTKLIIYLILFGIFDLVIPVPITALLLIYVIVYRPKWFKDLFVEIYGQ